MEKLGIDVGGTNIKVVYLRENSITSNVFATPKNFTDFKKVLGNILVQHPGIESVGLGLPGIIDCEKGRVLKVKNLPFLKNFNAKKFVEKHLRAKRYPIPSRAVKVKIENDVKCRAYAEILCGSASNFKNFVVLALGTGIGGAIVLDGKIFHGNGIAGEIGKMILENGKTFEDLTTGKNFNGKYR